MAPETPSRDGVPRRIWRTVFFASGVLPILALCGTPPDTMLLIYGVFVAAMALRGRFRVLRLPGPPWLRYLVFMVLTGFLTETLAWLSNYLSRAEQPALLHPQLAYDLLLSPGIYAAWAIGWIALTRRWRFSVAQVFVVQGIYGVFVEQQGAVFLKGLEAMPAGLLLYLYVFVVYGAAAGLGYLPFEASLPAAGARNSRWKLAAALPIQLLATAVVAIGWGLLLGAVGITVPDPKPIWEAPLW